jgi:PQQ-like domain
MYCFQVLLIVYLHTVFVVSTEAQIRQIVNIPWGAGEDFIDAAVCKTMDGTFRIPSSHTPNHRSRENVRTNIFRIHSLNGQIISEFRPQPARGMLTGLVDDTRIYLHNAQNKIYCYDVKTNKTDSLQTAFVPLYILLRKYKDKQSLLVTASSGYYFYESSSLKLLHQITVEQPLAGTGKPSINGNRIYCLMQNKELVCYDLETKKNLWTITTTPKAAKWLGITVGTFDDSFSHYTLSKDGFILYAVTTFGCIYKINAATGVVIKLIERFRGDANNAGLVTDFSLADINADGVEDLIGSAVDYNIYAINGKDLSVIWAYNTGYENLAGVSLYDITGDGVMDVFTINDQMKFSVINGKTGAKILEHQIQSEKSQAKVILADINGNGLLDIFISGGSQAIRAYEMPSVKVPVGGIFWIPEG